MATHKTTTGKEGEWRGGRRSTPPPPLLSGKGNSVEIQICLPFSSSSSSGLPFVSLPPTSLSLFFLLFFPHPLLSFSALGCLFLPPQPRGELKTPFSLPPSLGIPAASWGLPSPPLLRHHCRRISLMDIDPSEKAFTAPSLFPPSLPPFRLPPRSPSLPRRYSQQQHQPQMRIHAGIDDMEWIS